MSFPQSEHQSIIHPVSSKFDEPTKYPPPHSGGYFVGGETPLQMNKTFGHRVTSYFGTVHFRQPFTSCDSITK